MSTIIAHLDTQNRQTILVADTLCSNGSQIGHRKNAKAFALGPRFYAGCAGNYRFFQILEYFCKLEHISSVKTKIDHGKELEWLVTEFVPHCIKMFENHKYPWNDETKGGGSVLLCVNDKIFKYEVSNGQVGEYTLPFYVIGSGSKYALGSLHTNRATQLSVETRIEQAMEAATDFDKSTEYLHTSHTKITIPWE